LAVLICVGEDHEVDQEQGTEDVGLVFRSGRGGERETVVVDHVSKANSSQSATREDVFQSSNDVLFRRILNIHIVNSAAATGSKTIRVAAHIALNYVRGGP